MNEYLIPACCSRLIGSLVVFLGMFVSFVNAPSAHSQSAEPDREETSEELVRTSPSLSPFDCFETAPHECIGTGFPAVSGDGRLLVTLGRLQDADLYDTSPPFFVSVVIWSVDEGRRVRSIDLWRIQRTGEPVLAVEQYRRRWQRVSRYLRSRNFRTLVPIDGPDPRDDRPSDTNGASAVDQNAERYVYVQRGSSIRLRHRGETLVSADDLDMRLPDSCCMSQGSDVPCSGWIAGSAAWFDSTARVLWVEYWPSEGSHACEVGKAALFSWNPDAA